MKQNGISLLETVVAATILAGSVMTVCGLSAKSLRSVRLNQEYEKAWDYMDRQLVLIDTAGVEVLTEGTSKSGQFESFDGRIWRWTAQAEETELVGLYDVSMQVEWLSAGRLRQIRCQTRLSGQPMMLDATEASSETTGNQGTGQR
ncbi:MAG: type IV pilus modification PilV family protein [Planctomycetota bacterium]|jgi:hypothetical protein